MGRSSKSEESWTPEQAAGEFAKGLQDSLEVFAPLVEAVTGYRARYIAEGFSEGAAEAMAVQYHGVVISSFLNVNRGSDGEG